MSTTTRTEVRTLASTSVADIAECDGIVYFLTKCCGASATGVSAGVACRACYTLVRDDMGFGALTSDPTWLAQAISALMRLGLGADAAGTAGGVAWARLNA